MRKDGNVSSWLEEQQTAISQLSAKDVGFKLSSEWYTAFTQSLRDNPDAGGLLTDSLPKCPMVPLAVFISFIVNAKPEQTFNVMTRKRGQNIKAILRSGIRKGEDVTERLTSADQAFDVRRKGMAEYCFGAMVLREYLKFRTGNTPTARQLAALLSAGLAATGRPPFQQVVDHDLLRRNLKNYEKRHPDLCRLATGVRAAQIVEVSLPSRPI